MVRSPGACSTKVAGAGGAVAAVVGVINKGPWTEAEDDILSAHIKVHGEGNWRLIPKLAGLSRCGKSCRLRWINYLRPDLKRGNFSLDEDNLILTLHALLGNRWSLISGRIPGRTDNEIKNYWNTHLRRKLRSMGIDPMNYKVGLTLNTDSSNSDSATDDQEAERPVNDFVPSSSSAAQNHNTVASSLQLNLPAQLVSSPDVSSTSTSYDCSTSATNSEPYSCPTLSQGETPATRQQLEPWMHLHSEISPSTTLSSHVPAAVCLNTSNSVPNSVAAGSCGWEHDQFRIQQLQLLDPLELLGMLQTLESSHVHNVDVKVAIAPWTPTTSGSLFASLLD